MRNLRTLPDAVVDNSALNLAISDILSARDLLLECHESAPAEGIGRTDDYF